MTSFVTAKYDALSGQILDPNSFITSPYTLKQSAVPSVLPSSGTSNATGQITLTTALPYQPVGPVSLYLPAGVVTAGAQGTGAGLYQVVFSSTTVCQIQGTGIVTANAAYTQTTGADINLMTTVVPGGAMGANGSLRTTLVFANNNSVNNKIFSYRFGTAVNILSTQTTSTGTRTQLQTHNRGSLQSNYTFPSIGATFGSTANTPPYSSIDTSVNQPLQFFGQLATAADFMFIECYTVEVLPSA